MIKLGLNGKERELDGPVNLVTFLEGLDINSRRVAIGYNGEVISRDRYQEVVLKDGDVLDIVQMVGGG